MVDISLSDFSFDSFSPQNVAQSGGGLESNLIWFFLTSVLISVIILVSGLRTCDKDSTSTNCKNLKDVGISGTVICGVFFFIAIAVALFLATKSKPIGPLLQNGKM